MSGLRGVNDCVLTYHTTPFSCGVAKFNYALAERLSVPCRSLETGTGVLPLVSIKPSEIPAWQFPCPAGPYDLFLHDWQDTARNKLWLRDARKVYAGNQVIWRQVQAHRPDVTLAWCPSTVTGNADRGQFSVLLFGMGHKVQPERLQKLKSLLAGLDYTVHVSTAVHEGNPWDEAFASLQTTLGEVFGDRLRLLGYLADDGLVAEMRRADLIALFFNPAARANNTTLWAAMQASKPVVTNLDDDSPRELVNGHTVIDIDSAFDLTDAAAIGYRAGVAVMDRGWERLLTVLR